MAYVFHINAGNKIINKKTNNTLNDIPSQNISFHQTNESIFIVFIFPSMSGINKIISEVSQTNRKRNKPFEDASQKTGAINIDGLQHIFGNILGTFQTCHLFIKNRLQSLSDPFNIVGFIISPPAAAHPHNALRCSAARTSLALVVPVPAFFPASPPTADDARPVV